MPRHILAAIVVTALTPCTLAFAQDAPLVVTPTGPLVVHGWGDDWNLPATADLQAPGFRFRGAVLGEGNLSRGSIMALASCRPCLAGETVAVVGDAHFLLGSAELVAGSAVGVWAQSQFDDFGSRLELTATGGVVTLPKVPPGKGKPHRRFVLTAPVVANLSIEIRPYLAPDSPVTYVHASNLATVTVTVDAFWDKSTHRWEYSVGSEEPYTYVLGATMSKKDERKLF